MATEKSLYERLGGANGISHLVDEIINAHLINPGIKSRFTPILDDPEHFKTARQHLINFLSAGSGGPEVYTGRDMKAAHRGMNISEAEYMNAMDDIMNVLQKNNIDEITQKDVLFIAYQLKNEMIRA